MSPRCLSREDFVRKREKKWRDAPQMAIRRRSVGGEREIRRRSRGEERKREGRRRKERKKKEG